MKIIRGKKKVKWGKSREEQNMTIEINRNIKSSGLICTNLKDKKYILKIMQERKYPKSWRIPWWILSQ